MRDTQLTQWPRLASPSVADLGGSASGPPLRAFSRPPPAVQTEAPAARNRADRTVVHARHALRPYTTPASPLAIRESVGSFNNHWVAGASTVWHVRPLAVARLSQFSHDPATTAPARVSSTILSMIPTSRIQARYRSAPARPSFSDSHSATAMVVLLSARMSR